MRQREWFLKNSSICSVTEDQNGHIVREMTRKTADYDMTLKTSDVQGRGTEANVYLQIFGENGTSDELKNTSHLFGDTYRTGEHSVFSFKNMPSLGVLKKLQLRMVKAETWFSDVNPVKPTMEVWYPLKPQQMTLLVVGAFGAHWILRNYLDGFLVRRRYFGIREWLQRIGLLRYKIPKVQSVTKHKRLSVTHALISDVKCENFPDDRKVGIAYFDVEDGCCLGGFAYGGDHQLTTLKKTTKRIKVLATDSDCTVAETEFTIDDPAVPSVEPITNHTRLSVSHARIRKVECKNFPDVRKVTVVYHDVDGCCLGEFQLSGEHHLKNLKETTRKIKVEATDPWKNIAETEFVIDEMPAPTVAPITNHARLSVSRARISKVDCTNFPDGREVEIVYYDLVDGESLGKFHLGGDHHQLTNLKTTTERIKVMATDCYENVAETEFTIDSEPDTHLTIQMWDEHDQLVERKLNKYDLKEAKMSSPNWPVDKLDRIGVKSDKPGNVPFSEVQSLEVVDSSKKCRYYDTCRTKCEIIEDTDENNNQIKEEITEYKVEVKIHRDFDGFIQNGETRQGCKFASDLMYSFFAISNFKKVRLLDFIFDVPDDNKESSINAIGKGPMSVTLYKEQTEISKFDLVREKTHYKVTVKTSDSEASGTDMKLFLQIFGDNGTSDERELVKHSSPVKYRFRTGKHKVFSFKNIRSLGTLNKLVIRAVEAGHFGKRRWRLEYIHINDQETGRCYTFPCNDWLTIPKDKKELKKELKVQRSCSESCQD